MDGAQIQVRTLALGGNRLQVPHAPMLFSWPKMVPGKALFPHWTPAFVAISTLMGYGMNFGQGGAWALEQSLEQSKLVWGPVI